MDALDLLVSDFETTVFDGTYLIEFLVASSQPIPVVPSDCTSASALLVLTQNSYASRSADSSSFPASTGPGCGSCPAVVGL